MGDDLFERGVLVSELPSLSRRYARTFRIDVPGERSGLDLIERLGPLHAELAPSPDGCCQVRIEARRRPGRRDVRRIFEIVAAWARAYGIESARLELDGREVVVSAARKAAWRNGWAGR